LDLRFKSYLRPFASLRRYKLKLARLDPVSHHAPCVVFTGCWSLDTSAGYSVRPWPASKQ